MVIELLGQVAFHLAKLRTVWRFSLTEFCMFPFFSLAVRMALASPYSS